MRLNLHGSRDDNMGYGRMFVGLTAALERAGVEIYEDENIVCETRIWCCLPNHVTAWWQGQRAMVFTMYESDHLPCGMHENIHEFETIFVPSRQCVEMFSLHHPNVIQVPLGIDPLQWPLQERPPLDRFFNVFMPGQGKRKGTDLAFRVFQTAFPKQMKLDPEPHLMAKAVTDDGFSDERMEKRLGVISSDEERSFYTAAHVSLNLARGEGWGLMPMQSISCGIPTILSDAHGHAEFSHLGLPVPCTKVPAGVFLYGDSGRWWEPDFDTAVDLLRDVYQNYEAHLAVAQANAKACHAEFHWDHSARTLMEAVGQSDFIPRGELYRTTARQFLLRVNRYIDPSIAGIRYEFEREHDYWVPADVRRVLQDAGYLEDSCLEDQAGRLMEAVA